MFQLIVAVIAIALVAALAIASIYYGGSAFQKGTLKAEVTQLVNSGQQIAGALTLYEVDNGGADVTGTIDASSALVVGNGVETYLASVPSDPAIASGDWTVVPSSGTTSGFAYIALSSAGTSSFSAGNLPAAISDLGGGAGTQFYSDGTNFYFATGF